MFKYLISFDLTKSYLSLKALEHQRGLLQVLYSQTNNNTPKTYYFNRTIFGLKSSGFILTKSIKTLLTKIIDDNYLYGNQDVYQTALILHQSMYVDDFVASLGTERQCEIILKNAIYIFKLAHFDVKKNFSNSKKLMDSIPTNDKYPSESLNDTMEVFQQQTVSTLGIKYCLNDDSYSFCPLKLDEIASKSITTKRSLSSVLHSIFDQLGIIQPILINFKILLSKLFVLKINWGEKLPSSAIESIKKFQKLILELKTYKIPRCLNMTQNPNRAHLYIFSDASSEMLGILAFLVVESDEKDNSTKFAPNFETYQIKQILTKTEVVNQGN